MAMYLVTRFCIAHRRYIECLTSLKNWGHLIYGLVGGVGLFAGLLLRYVIVRVFIVFRLFGREWSFDLKDRGREDNHKDPS